MRISDWSSDVCSSDLQLVAARQAQAGRDAEALLASARKTLADERAQALAEAHHSAFALGVTIAQRLFAELPATLRAEALRTQVTDYLTRLPAAQRQQLIGAGAHQIGRASCRERGCQYV